MDRFQLTRSDLKTALRLFFCLTLITGVIYPLAVTGFAQVFFPSQANGSLLKQGDKVIGSQLIGQLFTDAGYFWGRPSAASLFPYNGASSSGSNLGPSNPVLLHLIKERVDVFHQFDLDKKTPIPVDLVTASASGLDPEISPLAAYYQVPRIAKTRHVAEKDLNHLITQHLVTRTLGVWGEPRVNVLQLNLALDQLETHHD
ncbi:potassium-transporting ATPase subunit KdpC [Legionella maioricensis]|uniref:Potassium-transporting ATPase KdpC subunit n=1 Tax=Legionella maioricensis TaxID=2896528 RepID=A0A9X2IA76_9GAMM|nr:potassium-transporting ATPase subunit KdpC [Legionella maioricensis]MCL9683226.1 potassium-transporting ATPase subunit KdpC [Legionella maioricensis]MCL9686076.1 potassium-transporting ATPase subunit KdpC [Legionella maioricensis]